MYHYGNGVNKDYNQALNYYQKVIEQKTSNPLQTGLALLNMGTIYQYGEGFEENSNQALDLYEKSCDADLGMGCNNAGSIYLQKGNYTKAANLFKKGCTLELGWGACSNMAFMYYDGIGVNKNITLATGYFDKACKLGHQDSCDNYRALLNY